MQDFAWLAGLLACLFVPVCFFTADWRILFGRDFMRVRKLYQRARDEF